MKVLLLKDVDNLGYAGEVRQVANGYGRNFLIPRGMAVMASPGVLKQYQTWRERADTRREQLRAEHEALAARIVNTRLVFSRRAGEAGKLYGSVTTADIVDRLNKELGTEIDRRVVVGEPLRQLGEHQVTVRLSRDVQPQLIINVHPHVEEDEEAEQVDAAEAEVEETVAEEIEETAAEEEVEVIAAGEAEFVAEEEFAVDAEAAVEEVDEDAEMAA